MREGDETLSGRRVPHFAARGARVSKRAVLHEQGGRRSDERGKVGASGNGMCAILAQSRAPYGALVTFVAGKGSLPISEPDGPERGSVPGLTEEQEGDSYQSRSTAISTVSARSSV